MRATRCYINLDNLTHNFNLIKKTLNPSIKICSVLKANAYGHGIEQVASTLDKLGSYAFGVSCLTEVRRLRMIGITKPIFLLSFYLLDEVSEAIDLDVISFVSTKDQVLELDRLSRLKNKTSKVHIKVNTGMGRLGCDPGEVLELVRFIRYEAKNLYLEGMASHLAFADDLDASENIMAKEIFLQKIKEIEPRLDIYHLANSDSTVNFNDTHLDMVRLGLVLYGYSNNQYMQLHLKPVMRLATQIVSIRLAKKGEKISYSGTYRLQEDSYIAVLPIGYADGYFRALSNKSMVFIKGKFYKQIGNICMDQMMINLGSKLEVELYDEVVLLDGYNISASDLSSKIGTINYEILTTINTDRIERIIE